VRGGFQGVFPNCGATGPKRESYDEARSKASLVKASIPENRGHSLRPSMICHLSRPATLILQSLHAPDPALSRAADER
jgi:hypothetical protein